MTGSDTGRRAQLAAALERVEARVQAACRAAGRPRGDVTLVAVTKTRPASDVALLAELGVRDVGESKAQEAESKVAETGRPELRWHMVGRLQRNKARSVAGWAAVVHSLDRAPLVVALGAHGASSTSSCRSASMPTRREAAPRRATCRPSPTPSPRPTAWCCAG